MKHSRAIEAGVVNLVPMDVGARLTDVQAVHGLLLLAWESEPSYLVDRIITVAPPGHAFNVAPGVLVKHVVDAQGTSWVVWDGGERKPVARGTMEFMELFAPDAEEQRLLEA